MSKPYISQDIWDDLVVIEDRASKILGRDYTFQFIRENRHPALDLIHEDSGMPDYDIVVLEGSTITIDPIGFDPDEDNLTYFFSGWKATENATFNVQTGQMMKTRYPLGATRNWTNSLEYTVSRRKATYKTSRYDIGPHNVTVYVCDEF